ILNKMIDIITGCFQPVLGPLCASGIIKGLNALLLFLLGPSFGESGTYAILNAIGDTSFYFFPIILGYTAAKKFKVNVVVGLLIGGALCYPTIQADMIAQGAKVLGSLPIVGDYYTTFVGVPFIAANYTMTVIPVILIVAFASFVQKYAKKWVPEILQTFFVPFFVLLISVPVGLLFIGPIVSILTGLLTDAFSAIYSFSPVLTGVVVGFTFMILVIFGLHWALVPLAVINVTTLGYDTILIGSFGHSFALVAAIVAMYIKMKDKNRKALAIPAIISGIFGVTEPGIYGFALPEKKPFIFACIGSAIGGGIFAFLGGKSYIMGGLGVFGIVNFISETGDATGMYSSLICIAVSMVVAFLLTYFFWKDRSIVTTHSTTKGLQEDTKSGQTKESVKKEEILSPMSGKVIPLHELKDDAFAQGALGDGVGILPSDGKVVAPVSGVVTTLFPTLHAIGLTSHTGVEILIHVGIDTVQMEGRGFVAHIKQGDIVEEGQPLLTVDLEEIEKAGFSTQTPILITNSKDMVDILPTENKEIQKEENLITVLF
ncbi:MAG: glucose PTS transporter subunit IIA, partial [Erysipelotrichaceae bacterium]|nr:glucose PTS transporter subunit IIA [Erysipelotrichaceae bacterium]